MFRFSYGDFHPIYNAPMLGAHKTLETLRRADPLMCEAHSLVLDVYLAREKAGELIAGDALTQALRLLSDAITTLRDAGESPDHYAAWERPPNTLRQFPQGFAAEITRRQQDEVATRIATAIPRRATGSDVLCAATAADAASARRAESVEPTSEFANAG